MSGAELARAAERLVGAPFRLHGRDPATGLDCVGVIAASFAACGSPVAEPRGYALRSAFMTQWLDLAQRAGLAETAEPAAPGDVLLVRPGPAQHHLLIAATGDRFVHAHAGLRRVVAQPGPLPWPTLRRWRLPIQD